MDWTSFILGAIAAAIIGVPFSIFSNIITSPVQTYLKNRRLSKLQRKINEILDDLEEIESLSDSFESVVVYFLIHFAVGLIFITLLIIVIGVYIVFPSDTMVEQYAFAWVMGYGGYTTCKLFYTAGKNFSRSNHLEEETEKAIAKLQKLDIKPDEIDALLKKLKEEDLDKDEEVQPKAATKRSNKKRLS